MNIDVDRFISDDDTTVSKVSVDGVFICFGLEDEFREEKIVGETRIPAGTYRVTLRKEGGFDQRYARRFPEIHEGMLHIRDVPDFEYVLIHCGNTDEDTAGCLLVGMQANTETGNMSVVSSAIAYKTFYPLVAEAAGNDDLSITFTDNDRS